MDFASPSVKTKRLPSARCGGEPGLTERKEQLLGGGLEPFAGPARTDSEHFARVVLLDALEHLGGELVGHLPESAFVVPAVASTFNGELGELPHDLNEAPKDRAIASPRLVVFVAKTGHLERAGLA